MTGVQTCALPIYIVVSADLWNHYAAAVLRARIPVVTVPLARGKRLNGRSQMNFYSLVVHGFSAMSVFIDIISVRLLAVTVVGSIASLGAIAAVIAVRCCTDIAVPSWVTAMAPLLILVFPQTVLLAVVLVFLVMQSRSNLSFLPIRDAQYFMGVVQLLWQRPLQEAADAVDPVQAVCLGR